MPLRHPQKGESLGFPRGSGAICMLTRGVSDLLVHCMEGVLAHTPPEVPVLIANDCGPEGVVEAMLAELEPRMAEREVFYMRVDRSVGFPENMNMLLAMSAPADVLILNDDCEVAEGWYEGLRAAAYSDSTVATSTALTNHGSMVSIPERNHPLPDLPDGWTVDTAAAAIRQASRRLYPRLPAMVGHCAYIRRSAIDLVGPFDLAFAPGYGEEVDFSQRCLLRGLGHVVADDVFVLHRGSATFNERTAKLQADHEQLIARRYPYYHGMVMSMASTRAGPLPRAIATATRALTGLSVTIDGSCLGSSLTGTQLHILELIQGLHRAGGVRLRVAVPRYVDPHARTVLGSLAGVELIVIDDMDEEVSRSDVVHRPYQVGTVDELRRLGQFGDRLVVTQQDFIAFHNPGYFRSFEDWDRYCRITRIALKRAERVVFFSHHAACEAMAEELVEPDRSRVVYIGVDHHHAGAEVEPSRPKTSLDLEGRGFILSLGVDFVHKNRLFALKVMEELQRRHRWRGCLVLAGAQASPGSSAAMDEAFLRERPELKAATAVVGAVSESEKRWLFGEATLMIAPTTYEGFGLIPFEAADANLACLFAPQASLAEVLPKEVARIEPWDAALTADRAMHLIEDQAERQQLVDMVRRASVKYRWDRTAQQLLEVYREAVDCPARDPGGDGLLDGGLGAPVTHYSRLLRAASKAIGWWAAYGLLRGSWHGGTAMARKLGRKVLRRPSGPRRASRQARP